MLTWLEVVRGGAADSPGDADWTDSVQKKKINISSLFFFLFLNPKKKWIKSVYTEKQFLSFFLFLFLPFIFGEKSLRDLICRSSSR